MLLGPFANPEGGKAICNLMMLGSQSSAKLAIRVESICPHQTASGGYTHDQPVRSAVMLYILQARLQGDPPLYKVDTALVDTPSIPPACIIPGTCGLTLMPQVRKR